MSILDLLIVILVLAWLVGGVAFPAVGSLLNVLIVVAIVILLVRLVRGEKL